jgi:signal transduction histidine kinase/CheY-like chemotaxis protein
VIALWLRNDTIRVRMLQDTRRRAEAERAALTVKSARETAKQEQELNDYIAHEVRNPLAAAMSACSFVKCAVEERKPLMSEESISSVREDVEIIDTSLAFMNDLLRSMLDMHRAGSKKMRLEVGPVDVLQDIVIPVASMLYQRNSTFEVLTECPENLFVLTDKMRLKQIMLNLGRNSSKFVQKGFILFGASVVDGNIRLIVEDSGPGISKAKQKRLFSKFQESLDLTNQGTGMGLCLCKHMVELLDGDIWLDPLYNSGIAGSPGSKFTIDLKMPPMTDEEYTSIVNPEDKVSSGSTASATASIPEENPPSCTSLRFADQTPEPSKNERADVDQADDTLPEKFSVLFVDDDLVLRKLFTRSVQKAVAGWDIKEAANGETALRMAETEKFDLIFIDQYMSSVEKQLLGTETARALRSRGITSRICGLSANDVEQGFKQAGADDFLLKPLPCKPDELRRALVRVIHGNGSKR